MIQKIPMLPDCIFNSLQFILPCSSVPVNLKSSRFFFDKRHGIVILFGPSADVSLCRFLDKSGGSIYPAFTKYFLPELVQKYPYDPAKAKELLAQAGYPNGFDMTISVPSNYQPHMDTAEVVAEQLRAVGVNVTIQPMEWGVWHEQVYKGRDFQATLVGLDASAMTARALLERFTSDHAKNFVNYNNPDYDALFTQALNASDDAQQAEIYKQMETMLSDTAANLYIQDLADLVAMRQNLAGLEFYPIYVLDLSTISYEK